MIEHFYHVNPLQYLNMLLLGNCIESRMGKKLKDHPEIANPLLSNSCIPFMEKLQERNHREQVGKTDSRTALISSNS